jgi:CBS domain-containing protein
MISESFITVNCLEHLPERRTWRYRTGTGRRRALSSVIRTVFSNPDLTMSTERPISELLRKRGVIVYTGPATSVQEACETMSNHNIGSIAVMDGDRNLCGIFTERDLMNRVVTEGRDPSDTRIDEVMTEDVIVVSGDTSRSEALSLMQEEHIRHLPIADEDELYGIVSLRDLLTFEREMQQFEIEQLREFVFEKPYPSYPG